MILQELLNSGLPWSKPKYDGADVLLFSQSDDPLMKGRFLQSKNFIFCSYWRSKLLLHFSTAPMLPLHSI